MNCARHSHRLSDGGFSERFATTLPQFTALLEGEWKDKRDRMNLVVEEAFRQAHRALGTLNEILDDQE